MKTIYSHACNTDYDMDSYLPEGCIWASTGIYLHGELERLIGYDIVYVPVEERIHNIDNQEIRIKQRFDAIVNQIDEGIHDVIVKADGKEHAAKAYVYRADLKYYEGGKLRGLVVLESDTESVEYALKCYTEKHSCL